MLLHKLGASNLGIWSLILSTTSVANVATTGLTLSLVKYVATCDIELDQKKINQYIQTSLLVIIFITGIIIGLVYFLGQFFLPKVIPKSEVVLAMNLLPLSLLSLFLNSIAGVFLSTIEGLHKSALKSIAYILSSFIFLIVAFTSIKDFGLFGIAYAQIIQAFFLILCSIFFLSRIFRRINIFPLKFHRIILKEILGYSLSFQYIGVCTLLIEPTVKFMISKYGGLSYVGFYEMSSRLVNQIRQLVISANQIMVPQIAKNAVDKSIDTTYPVLFRLVLYISFYLMILIFLLSPIISIFWIGNLNPMFVNSLMILSFATALNLISTPAYFSSMGLGNLKGILACHTSFLILNIILGYFGGTLYGGVGVIFAYAISFISSSFITIIYYHKVYGFTFYRIINFEGKGLHTIMCVSLYIILAFILVNSVNFIPMWIYLFLGICLSFVYIGLIYLNDRYLKLVLSEIINIK